MQVVIDSPASVRDYAATFPRVLVSAPRECPVCGGKMKGHGRRYRWVISLEGVFRVPIQRMICKVCRRSVSLLPRMLYAFCSCTRRLVATVKSLWERGLREMRAVWHLLADRYCMLPVSLSSLYRWASHTN